MGILRSIMMTMKTKFSVRTATIGDTSKEKEQNV